MLLKQHTEKFHRNNNGKISKNGGGGESTNTARFDDESRERNFSNEPNETYTECNVKDMFSTMIRASV